MPCVSENTFHIGLALNTDTDHEVHSVPVFMSLMKMLKSVSTSTDPWTKH